MVFKKSRAEAAADAGMKAMRRGRATTGEAADIFKVSKPTIRNWINDGKLSAVWLGKRQMISLDSIVAAGGVLPPLSMVKDAKVKHFDTIDTSSGDSYDDYYD